MFMSMLQTVPSVTKALDAMEKGTVSTKYQPIDSEAPLQVAGEVLERNGISYQAPNVVRPRKGSSTGHFVKIALNMPITVNGDTVNPMLVLSNDHEGKGAFRLMIGLYRQVCSNGLVVGSDIFNARIIHVQGPKSKAFIDQVSDIVQKSLDYIANTLVIDLHEATKTDLTHEQGVNIINQLGLSKRLTDKCLTVWQYPLRKEDSVKNVWGLWNIVNECMRKSSRSAFADTKKNVNLLNDILEIVNAA